MTSPRRSNDSDERNLPSAGTISAITAQHRHPDRLNIFLDGVFAFALTREDALRNGVRIGQNLTADEIALLRAGDQTSKAIESALRLLTVRPRTEQELRKRLLRKDYPAETVETVISRMQHWGYLDDASFARFWVANRNEHRPRAERMLRLELRQKGIDRETIEETLGDAGLDDDAAALALAEKFARKAESRDPLIARRRLAGQLARRGFDYETIRRVLDQVLGDSDTGE